MSRTYVKLESLRPFCALCGDDLEPGQSVVLAARSENDKRVAVHARHFEADRARRQALGLDMKPNEITYHNANLRIVE